MTLHCRKARRASWRLSVGLVLACAAGGVLRAKQAHATPAPCRVTDTNFDGWKAIEMNNTWVKLTIVPQLGGRVMQVEFAGHPYLFINPKYKGKYVPPPADAAEKGTWFNYGGDKIWPMPEGNQDASHWPGPIADALDDGEYSAKIVSQGESCQVRLDGPADPRTGLQYSREITLGAGSPAITFDAIVKNAAPHRIVWSVQTVTQYNLADPKNASTYNHDFWAYTPVNPKSVYLDKFHVRAGLADDPSFSVQNGLFTLHWLYLQNEVWIDSPGGWVAVADRSSHFAMVERFPVYSGYQYPGKATVIFYKNGPAVELDDTGMPQIRSNPEDSPFYMEAEINSPMEALNPGEVFTFRTQWFPTRAGDGFVTANQAGLVAEPLSATAGDGKIRLKGTFGVFFPGTLEARVLDADGKELATVSAGSASPDRLLTLDQNIAASSVNAARVEIDLIDDAGNNQGFLADASLASKAGGH